MLIVRRSTRPVLAAAGSFLARFLAATQGMDPAAVGAFLEHPPEGAPDIEAAHQVGGCGLTAAERSSYEGTQ